jgi:spore germination cell wall hydrolase CwlJ-like protein
MLAEAVVCLALNIYFEARGEPLDGQLLVAEVTLNRAKNRNQTVCEVVWDKKQFSWTHDGKSDKPRDLKAYAHALDLAEQVLIDPDKVLLGTPANYFHATHIKKPKWAKKMTVLGKNGNHIFYTDRE